MGFLEICAGVVLLQLSKSAKDVPDSAVFKGDLDQVREIAEQEESEHEPKADAIRGSAAIIRRLSQTRRNAAEQEAKRYLEEKRKEHLEPLAENEVAEWDGLRRRKTIIGEGSFSSPSQRRKTIHPPLGMSHVPNEEDAEEARHRVDSGLFEGVRSRTKSVLGRNRDKHNASEPSPMHPMVLSEINIAPNKDSPHEQYGAPLVDESSDHIYGLPSALQRNEDESEPYTPRSKPLPRSPSNAHNDGSESPIQTTRRQFSFTNFLRRNSRATDTNRPTSSSTNNTFSNDGPPHPMRSQKGIGSRSASHDQKMQRKHATEEERAGLVTGDSFHHLHSERDHPYAHEHHYPSSSTAHESHYPPPTSHVPLQSHRAPSPIQSQSSDEDEDWQMTNRTPPSIHEQQTRPNDILYSRTTASPDRLRESTSRTTLSQSPPPQVPPHQSPSQISLVSVPLAGQSTTPRRPSQRRTFARPSSTPASPDRTRDGQITPRPVAQPLAAVYDPSPNSSTNQSTRAETRAQPAQNISRSYDIIAGREDPAARSQTPDEYEESRRRFEARRGNGRNLPGGGGGDRSYDSGRSGQSGNGAFI